MMALIPLEYAERQLAAWRKRLHGLGTKTGPERVAIHQMVKYWRDEVDKTSFSEVTLEDARLQLDRWLAVSMKIAEQGRCTVENEIEYTVEDMGEVQQTIEFWKEKVKERLPRRGRRVRSKGI